MRLAVAPKVAGQQLQLFNRFGATAQGGQRRGVEFSAPFDGIARRVVGDQCAAGGPPIWVPAVACPLVRAALRDFACKPGWNPQTPDASRFPSPHG